jgi:hypothetical protein
MTDSQLYLLLEIYNDVVATISWKHQIRVKPDKPLKSYPWYPDLVNLYNIVHTVGAKPREYIKVQLDNYKQPTKFSRVVPTIRMMTTVKAMETWEKSKEKPKAIPRLSDEYLIDLSIKYMHNLMVANSVPTDEDFFKDPFNLQVVSKSFLKVNPVFNKLLDEGYYSRFGLSREDLV